MYYEINVSLNGTHFFATNERSIQTEDKYHQVLKALQEKFPESEGYHVSASLYEKKGTILIR